MHFLKILPLTTLAVVLCTPFFSATAQADITEQIENALKFNQADAKYGQLKVDLRYRFEQLDTDAPKQIGNESVLRWRLGYLTPEFQGFQGFAEYAGNQDIVINDYYSTRNGKTPYETIPDPQQHVLNQMWINFKGLPNTEIKLGRQRLNLDNQRFVGSVDWRMMEQVLDGVSLTNTSLPNTTLKAGYMLKRQTITSTTEGMQFPFLNVNYNLTDIGNFIGYGYWMDFNEIQSNAIPLNQYNQSNQTYGIRFDGSRKINETFKGLYTAEYAYQENYGHNTNPYSADYYHFIGGMSAFGVTAKAGFEQLGGKGAGKTFNTPLATLHIFNGWADQFLTTPGNGLRDIYGALNAEVVGIKLTGVYHEYSDDSGKFDYGKEWNFLATKEFFKHYTLLAKYAYYDAPSAKVSTSAGNSFGKVDAQRFWLGASLSF